jgi:hemerythrin superfamily protein
VAKDALDAIALLKADHREVEELFAKAEKEIPGSTAKQDVVARICQALTVHAQIEEEIAYPAFRQAGAASSVMDEAAIEHKSVKDVVEELQGMSAADDKYDARVKVLSEYVKHHVKEEETEMFQEVEATDADVEKIGEQLIERKRELMKGIKERPAA